MLAHRMMMAAGGKGDFRDTTGSPGPTELLHGDSEAGFFGEVSPVLTNSEVASLVGITDGIVTPTNPNWIKYAWKGKVCFIPKMAVRYRITWSAISAANSVFGGSLYFRNGMTFRVRLVSGFTSDPADVLPSEQQMFYSEWNRIILPLHRNNQTGNWQYPTLIEPDLQVWTHNYGTGGGMYTNADLGFNINDPNGSEVWCQESYFANSNEALFRGTRIGNGNAEYAFRANKGSISSYKGWRPVLEVV